MPQDTHTPTARWNTPGRPSREEALKALRAEGVDTVEALVDRMLGSIHTRSRPANSLNAGLLGSQACPKGLTHQPPQVPLHVDGVAMDPEDITRFNGRPLHSIVVPGASGRAELHAFTSDEHVRYLKGLHAEAIVTGRSRSAAAAPAAPADPRRLAAQDAPYTIGQIQMFEHIDYGGDWWWLPANTTEHNVRLVERGCFLWWCSDWNDTISSLAATDTKVIYWSDINFAGSTLTVYPYFAVPDLRVYGWNDVISSVWNVGY